MASEETKDINQPFSDNINEYLNLSQKIFPDCLFSDHISVLQEEVIKKVNTAGEFSPEVFYAYDELATLCYETSQLELALKYSKKCCQISEKCKPLSLPHSLHKLSKVQIALSDFQEAHQHLNSCLNILEKDKNQSDIVARVYHNKAELFLQQGQYDNAFLALDMIRKNGNLNRSKELEIDTNFLETKLYGYQANVSKMEDLMNNAMKSFLDYQKDVKNTTLNMIACCFYILGKYEETKKYSKEALKVSFQSKRIDFLAIIETYLRLADIYLIEGDVTHATRILEESHNICTKFFGENSHTATCLVYLGKVYYIRCDFDKSKEYLEKALEIRCRLYGANHPLITEVYQKLGEMYLNSTRYSTGLNYFERALDIQLKLFGKKPHYDVAFTYNGLGKSHFLMRNISEAEQYFKKALEMMVTLFDEKHPNVADYYGNMSVVYARTLDKELQFFYLKKAFKIQKRILGKYHHKTAPAYQNLSFVYCQRGDHQKALKMCNKAIEIRIKAYGDSHPLLSDTYFRLAMIYKAMGEQKEALKILMLSFKMNLKFYHISNRRNMSLVHNIMNMYYSNKNIEAAESYRKILTMVRRSAKEINLSTPFEESFDESLYRYSHCGFLL